MNTRDISTLFYSHNEREMICNHIDKFLEIYDAPIEFVSDFSNRSGAYEKVIFTEETNSSYPTTKVIDLENGTFVYRNDLHYKVNYSFDFLDDKDFKWTFHTTSRVTAYSIDGSEMHRDFMDFNKLYFYDWPENVDKPTTKPRFFINCENQRVEIYDEQSITVDGEWYRVFDAKYFRILFRQ